MAGAFQGDAFQGNAFDLGGGGSGSLTADAVLAATPAASLSADATLASTAAGSFTADASIAATFPADAALLRAQSGSLTADAATAASQAGSLTADAVALGVQAASLVADAILGPRFLADAIVKRTMTGSLSASAWLYKARSDPDGQGDPGETPLVSIMVGETDITSRILFEDASFTMATNGSAGEFSVTVRDDDQDQSFAIGSEVTVDIDGKRRFGGYLTKVTRKFAFPVDDTVTRTPTRYLVLTGPDYNILFQKRVIYDKVEPSNVLELYTWPVGSTNDVVVRHLVDNFTDLTDDGLTYLNVQNIGSPNPDLAGAIGHGGMTFGQAMTDINRFLSGLFFIDPYKDLHHVDVNSADASVGLSDQPGEGQVGYRELEQTSDAGAMINDVIVWGAGKGSKQMVMSRATDTDSVTAHGRWQKGEFTSAMYKQSSVDARAETIVYGTPQSLRGGKDDQESWTVVTYDWSFGVGQKVAIESVVFGRSDIVPIRRLTMTFAGTSRRPRFALLLSHEIDAPWFIFDQWRIDNPVIPVPTIPNTPACDIDNFLGRTVSDGWGTASGGDIWSLESSQIPPNSVFVTGAAGYLQRAAAPDVWVAPGNVYTGVGALSVDYTMLEVGQRLRIFWAIKGSPSKSYTVTVGSSSRTVTTKSNGMELVSTTGMFNHVRRVGDVDTWSITCSSTAPTAVFIAVVLPAGRYNFDYTLPGRDTTVDTGWYVGNSQADTITQATTNYNLITSPFGGRNSMGFALACSDILDQGDMTWQYGTQVVDVYASDLHVALAYIDEDDDPGHTRTINGLPFPTVHYPASNNVFVGIGAKSLGRALCYISPSASGLGTKIDMPIPYDITLTCEGGGGHTLSYFHSFTMVNTAVYPYDIYCYLSQGDGMEIVASNEFWPISPVNTGVDYGGAFHIRLAVTAGGTCSAKVWAVGSEEPASWQASRNFTFTGDLGENRLTVNSDSLLVSCVRTQSGGGGIIPLSGWSRYSQATDGVTQSYYTDAPYIGHTTLVYVNGSFQRRDYEYNENDPAAGLLYFPSAPPAGTLDVLYIVAEAEL